MHVRTKELLLLFFTIVGLTMLFYLHCHLLLAITNFVCAGVLKKMYHLGSIFD